MPIDPTAPRDKPETRQMKVIHQLFRREFGLLPGLVAAVAPGDTARAGVLAGHTRLLLGLLHEHHESEDTFLWPLLQQRVPMHQDLVDLMETQHQAVAALITAVEQGLADWLPQARGEFRDRVAADLKDLDRALGEHLDVEESGVLPLIHEHLSVAEWEAPQHAAAKGMPGGLRPRMVLVGAVLEDATPEEQRWFLGQMPPPARLVWRLIGPRMYATEVEAVRGGR